jgi:hypothetical protein
VPHLPLRHVPAQQVNRPCMPEKRPVVHRGDYNNLFGMIGVDRSSFKVQLLIFE